MARRFLALLGVVLFGLVFASAMAESESEFMAPDPEDYIQEEGGRIEVFSEKFKILRDAGMRAAMITVEPDTMSMPMYMDVSALKYVMQGEAIAGLISPLGLPTNVRNIKKGDVIAVPKGWTWWVWNNKTEDLRMMAVAHVATCQMKGSCNTFYLMGSKEEDSGGAVIHGFSKEMWARAWNVEEEDVEELLTSAKSTAFVKVTHEDAAKLTWQPSTIFFGDFVYNMKEADPEVAVKMGGMAAHLNAAKMPILRKMDMSFSSIHLEKGAMMAPHFTSASRVIHFLRGRGRMEMAYPDGQNAMRMDVEMEDTVVVPAMFPIAMWAEDDEPLEWVSFSNSEAEVPSFLAGYNSLYRALPRQVLQRGWNVPDGTFEKFDRKRRSRIEVAIFAPRGTLVVTGGDKGTRERGSVKAV